MRAPRILSILLLASLLAACSASEPREKAVAIGQVRFANPAEPQPFSSLSEAERNTFELGDAVFNTQWVPADTSGAGRRDGVGPLFNSPACDACHNGASRGRGASSDANLPASLVIQLESPAAGGDPVYGHVFNTLSNGNVAAEGKVTVQYRETSGRYADGSTWKLRQPIYELSDLQYGPLDASTVIRPRVGPQLYGVGLLERVALDRLTALENDKTARSEGVAGSISWQLVNGKRVAGRLGWQAQAVSIQDQTTRAFAREMGLTTRDVLVDDCTAAQRECRQARNGGEPEVSDEFLAALVHFQQQLAVPASDSDASNESAGAALFQSLGCAGCHRSSLRVDAEQSSVIHAYTDLLLHDMGEALADRDVSGRAVHSVWRTAPLWGLAAALRAVNPPSLLHDGRARSIEEAILWHGGQAGRAGERFQQLTPDQRRTMVRWLGHL